MATEAQIAANRANALKSTGPRTAAGKARSAQNALRHGFRARNIRTPAERSQQFNDLWAEFRAEYCPCTAAESALVHALATARWRALRMSSLEAARIDHELDRGLDPLAQPLDNDYDVRNGIAYSDAANNTCALDHIGQAESRFQNQFNRAFDRLLRWRTSGVPVNQPTKPVDKGIYVSHSITLTPGLSK